MRVHLLKLANEILFAWISLCSLERWSIYVLWIIVAYPRIIVLIIMMMLEQTRAWMGGSWLNNRPNLARESKGTWPQEWEALQCRFFNDYFNFEGNWGRDGSITKMSEFRKKEKENRKWIFKKRKEPKN